MAALGAVGLIAGLLFGSERIKKAGMKFRIILSVSGFVLAFAVYGLIVDISTILFVSGNSPTLKGALSVYAAGAQFSLIFGLSTAVFLFIFGEPFIRKINRVITKFQMK